MKTGWKIRIFTAAMVLLVIIAVAAARFFSGDAILADRFFHSMTSTGVKKGVLANIENFSSLLRSADFYLAEYASRLQRARDIASRGAGSACSPAERQKMARDICRNMDEAENIIRNAIFSSGTLFQDPSGKHGCRVYRVPLSELGPSEKFTLSADSIFGDGAAVLKKICRVEPSAGSMAETASLLDEALGNAELNRSVISSYQSRLGFAMDFLKLQLGLQPGSDRRKIGGLVREHYRSLESRQYLLAVQSASGVYDGLDRACLNIEYQELCRELRRLYGLTGVPNHFSGDNARMVSIATRDEARSEMDRLGRLLCVNK